MVNFESKIPLYHQLYELLHNKIIGGEWQPGDLIPTENELMGTYRLSRGTVRKALDELVKEGLIDRQRGRGSFITRPIIRQVANEMSTFIDDMRLRGFRPETRVIFSGLVPASEYVASQLRVDIGTELACIERLRLADEEPMSVEESFLVERLCPGILNHDYTRESLRQILAHDFDLYQASGVQTVRAMTASTDLAEKLNVPAYTSPILFIERVSYSQEDLPIEFLRIYHRGDRYALYNKMVGWGPERHNETDIEGGTNA